VTTGRRLPVHALVVASLAAALLLRTATVAAQGLAPRGAGTFTPAGVVVWLQAPGDDDALAACTEALAELRLAIVAEAGTGGAPAPERVAELLAIHRAVAAVWHDRDGRLDMALAGGGGSLETLQAAPGPPDAEAVFVREVLAARLEGGARPPVDLLVTVPPEPIRVPPGPLPRPEAPARATKPPSAWSGWLGAGYRARVHFDEATWGEHEIVALVPVVRMARIWVARLVLTAGLPVRIGERSERVLELSSLSASAAAGLIPWSSRHLDVEACVSAGAQRTAATAFWGAGESDRSSSVGALLVASAALGWRVTGGARIRLHLDGAYTPGATAYGMAGRGDFGGFPWQVGGGIDMELAVLGQ
jgi:hypothetical protein